MNQPSLAQQGPKRFKIHGHDWSLKAEPFRDSEGDMVSYAKCKNCGAIENTFEGDKDCP